MKIERRFTSPNEDAYSSIEFTKTTSEIRNPDGTVVFHLADLEVPASWSQVASDVLAQKYFRKAGVPSETKAVKESGMPGFLRRRLAAENATFGGGNLRQTSLRPFGWRMGLLGLEGWLFYHERGRQRLF